MAGGWMERCLTHRLPFPDRRPTEGGKTQPATSVDTRARRLLPSIPRSDRADRARRAVPVCRRAGRQRGAQDVWREGRRRLVRRRARGPDLPGALLPRRDPLAAGGREGLLERRGGHPTGARVRAAAQDRPRSDGRPRTHADEYGRGAADDPRWRRHERAGVERARGYDRPWKRHERGAGGRHVRAVLRAHPAPHPRWSRAAPARRGRCRLPEPALTGTPERRATRPGLTSAARTPGLSTGSRW